MYRVDTGYDSHVKLFLFLFYFRTCGRKNFTTIKNMAQITLGVNTESELFEGNNGKNRVRFESMSERLQKISVDILHKIPTANAIISSPSSNANYSKFGGDCLLLRELDSVKQLETGKHFAEFYWRIAGLVQSLPELLHNLEKVVNLFIEYVTQKLDYKEAKYSYPEPKDLGSYFCLISVLIRYSCLRRK